MDDRETPSLGTIIAEIGGPMIVSAFIVFLFTPIGMPWLLLSILIVSALAAAPVFIISVVRYCNRRDDLRQAKLPPDAP